MGRPDGGNHRRAALRLWRRNDPAVAAMAVGRYEHGKRSCLYDHRTCHKDYQSRGFKDCDGLETVCFVYSFCDAVFFPVRDACESDCVIK